MKLSHYGLLITTAALIGCTSTDRLTPLSPDSVVGTNAAGSTLEYYVAKNGHDSNNGSSTAPWATLPHAVATVQNARGPGVAKVILNIREGTYRLTAPLEINGNNVQSNTTALVIRNANTEKVMISGGVPVGNWTLHDAEKKIYKASVGDLNFRQVYINGKPAIRARTPNLENAANKGPYLQFEELDKPRKIIKLAPNLIAKWNQFERVEMIYTRDWITNVLRLNDYTIVDGKAELKVQEPERSQFFGRETPQLRDTDPFYFENAFGFLDANNEWYLNTENKTLYAVSSTGTAPTNVEVPVIETLVKIAGTADALAQSVRFEGLVFAHATWLTPERQGLTGGQSIFSNLANHPSGAIVIENAKDIAFEGCAIRNVGGHGVLLTGTSEGILFRGNIVENTAANGIVFFGSGGNGAVIEDNRIRKIGLDYGAGTGIVVQYSANIAIRNNDIWGVPYAGISVGWGWTLEKTHLANNIIERNDIHNVCQQMSDCGGIYTLSRQDGTKLTENWIHDVQRSAYANGSACNAIFHDEGSSEMTVQGNIFDNIDGQTVRRNKAGTIYREDSTLTPEQIRANTGPRAENTVILKKMNYHK